MITAEQYEAIMKKALGLSTRDVTKGAHADTLRNLRWLATDYSDTGEQIQQYADKKGEVSEEFQRYNREAVAVGQLVTAAIRAGEENLNLNAKQVAALRAIKVVGRLDSIEAAVEKAIAILESGTELTVETDELLSGFSLQAVQTFNRYRYHFKGLGQVTINIKHSTPVDGAQDGYRFTDERDALEITAYVRSFYGADGQMTGHEKYYEFEHQLEDQIRGAVADYQDEVTA